MERKRITMLETKELTATYDQESKEYRRVTIDEGQGVKGTLYFPKDEPIPRIVTIRLKQLRIKTKAEVEADSKK